MTLENLLKADPQDVKSRSNTHEMEFLLSPQSNAISEEDRLPRLKAVKVSSRQIQLLGLHSTDKAVSAFLQTSTVEMHLAVNATSDSLAKLIYYGSILRARQKLKKTPNPETSDIYNRGVVYAYSDLLP